MADFLYLHNYTFFYNVCEKPNYDLMSLIKRHIGRRTAALVNDRTETLSYPLNLKSIFPIPSLDLNFEKSLKQVCEETTRNILSEGKSVDIFWSGGVDSTLLLVTFLETCKDVSQLCVILEQRSIDEYPLFYEKYIKTINHKIVENYIYKNINLQDNIVVTGHPGGLLTGQWEILNLSFDEWGIPKDGIETIPWRDIFTGKKIIFDNKEQDEFFVEKIQMQLDKSPFPIETIVDLQWWLRYSLKWQGEIFAPLKWHQMLTYDYKHENLKNYKPFFANEDFQLWALKDFVTKIRYNLPQIYKKDFKDIILNFTQDEEYYANKGKVLSGHTALSENGKVGIPCNYAIDTDYNTYSLFDSIERQDEIFENFSNNGDDYKRWIRK